MAEALLVEFPTLQLGGPVTYSPPFQEIDGYIADKTWADWFVPLLKATADNPRMLGWVDYHAYDGADPHGKCQNPNCMNADDKTIDLNLQETVLLAAAMEREKMQSAITETNFALKNASDQFNWKQRFMQRAPPPQ